LLNRFGHTTIPPGIYQRDGKCNFGNDASEVNALRLCSSWWDAQVIDIRKIEKPIAALRNIHTIFD
jgi:dual oxidase